MNDQSKALLKIMRKAWFVWLARFVGLWMSSVVIWVLAWSGWGGDGIKAVACVGLVLLMVGGLEDMLALSGTKLIAGLLIHSGTFLLAPVIGLAALVFSVLPALVRHGPPAIITGRRIAKIEPDAGESVLYRITLKSGRAIDILRDEDHGCKIETHKCSAARCFMCGSLGEVVAYVV